VFGHKAFRGEQLEVIRRVLQRRSVLGIMPTGSGKSLCYQLPALLLPGLTVVVSPLLALMRDQLSRLPKELPGGCLAGVAGCWVGCVASCGAGCGAGCQGCPCTAAV
jgi:hypothetical protein